MRVCCVQQVQRSHRNMGSWGMIEAKRLLGICHRQLELEQRSIVEQLEPSSIVEQLVVGSIGSIVVEGLLADRSIGSIVVGERPDKVERSSGWQLVLCYGERRYHRWGSWGTCVGQLQRGIELLTVLMHKPQLSLKPPNARNKITLITCNFLIVIRCCNPNCIIHYGQSSSTTYQSEHF